MNKPGDKGTISHTYISFDSVGTCRCTCPFLRGCFHLSSKIFRDCLGLDLLIVTVKTLISFLQDYREREASVFKSIVKHIIQIIE